MKIDDLKTIDSVDRCVRDDVGDHYKKCACGAFAVECLVPVGDSAVPACWLCAHDYVEHNRAIGSASGAHCGCKRDQIYPASFVRATATA